MTRLPDTISVAHRLVDQMHFFFPAAPPVRERSRSSEPQRQADGSGVLAGHRDFAIAYAEVARQLAELSERILGVRIEYGPVVPVERIERRDDFQVFWFERVLRSEL